MKTIFITEEQKKQLKNIVEGKTPAAQDQVHGKVNAGIMDAVTCGGMMEGAEPESDEYKVGSENDGCFKHVCESEENSNSKLKKYMKKIADYMYDNGLNVKPLPKLELNWDKQDGIFIRTGYYDPNEKKVVVFCDSRNDKDILRSFAHEMIHHSQNLDGKNLSFSGEDNVKDSKELEKIEAEAYLKGNIFFRKWTEFEQENNGTLNEGKSERKKQVFNDNGDIVPDLCDECGNEVGLFLCGEPIYKCTKCGKYYGVMPFPNELNENNVSELESDEVDLSSFNLKQHLNPKFWKNGKLDSRIRMKLLDIADDFIESLGVDWVKPKDIIITGSLANYNWNKQYSDIDLHVLMDFSEVDERKDFVEKYFKAQKDIWNEQHESISIFGFPVEVYVQDIHENHTSSGVYSLERDEWIETPDFDTLAKSKINIEKIKQSVAEYATKIDKLFSIYKNCGDDEYKMRKVNEKADELFDTIKNERRGSLKNSNSEITTGNLIFKCLRRMNYIDKLSKLKTKTYDSLQSLNENENTVVISERQMRGIRPRLDEIKVRDKWDLETKKNKTNLNFNTYAKICSIDPTSKGSGDNMVAGKYCNWLLAKVDVSKISDSVYINGVRIALEQFNDGMKRGILQRSGINGDINKFKSVDELVSTMRGVVGGGERVSQSVSNHMEALKGQYEIAAESQRWMVVVPMTFEAERYFGSRTEWYTVGNEDYFNQYMDEGQLYITVPKNMDKRLKMQFHFESESFADFKDRVVSNPKSCIYSVIGDTDDLYEVFDMWDTVDDRFSVFKLVKFSDVERLLASGKDPMDVFDWYVGFHEGYAQVILHGKWNLIGTDRRLVSPNQWFDWCGDFHEGYVQVELNGKWNFIGKDGSILSSNQWFDWCDDFNDGYARLNLNGKWNFIGKDGSILSPNQWFDWCSNFRNGFAKVELDGESIYINTDGNLHDERPTSRLNENENSNFNVYVMCGCAGAGKSTWIKNNLPGIPVVSRDLIRTELGYCGNDDKFVGTKEQEECVTERENRMIDELCKSKTDFAIDNMNIKPKYRKRLIEKLRNFGAKITMVVLDTSLDACKQARNGQIPDEVIEKMHTSMSFPNKDEYDEIIVVKR